LAGAINAPARIFGGTGWARVGASGSAGRWSSGVRAHLNLGHTFGHASETCTGYQGYIHGEAIAIGFALAAELSRRRGLMSDEEVERLIDLLQRTGLPTKLKPGDPDPQSLHAATCRDKKTVDGGLRFVLASRLGQAKLDAEVPPEQARAVWEEAPRA